MNLPQVEMIPNHENAYHKDQVCIKILEGKYEGVIFQYDNIRYKKEQDPQTDLPLGDLDPVDPTTNVDILFNFITVKNPNKLELTDGVFIAMLSEMLTNFIYQNAEKQNG